MARRNPILKLLSIAFALGLLASHSVFAANDAAPATSAATTATCRATVDEQIAAARKALQSNDPTARAALACLIETTTALNKRLQGLESAGARPVMFSVPVLNVPVPPGRQ
jgi:uncharacterized membrane protein YccC